jgi:hypothetical protein
MGEQDSVQLSEDQLGAGGGISDVNLLFLGRHWPDLDDIMAIREANPGEIS